MPDASAATITKEWTLMFYFASDNNLAPSIVSQLKAIKEAGFHQQVNVIAQFDPHPVGTPLHIFDVNLVNKLKAYPQSDIGFAKNDPYVRNLVADKLWNREKDDSGEEIRNLMKGFLIDKGGLRHPYDPPRPPVELPLRPDTPLREAEDTADDDEPSPLASLRYFLKFCREAYPARHYVLFILGHGLVVGDDVFLFDDSAIPHSLSLQALGVELTSFNKQIRHKNAQLELVSFHSCSMSGLEVAYELKESANYMLASQGPAYVGSWPYRQILLRIFNDLAASRHTSCYLVKLREGADPVATYIRSLFGENDRTLLDDYLRRPQDEPSKTLIESFDKLLDRQLYDEEAFRQVELSIETKRLVDKGGNGDLQHLNRLLLADAYPEVLPPVIKSVLTKIFYYCLYNSYDFQLAGYSFDLCLCDLSRISQIRSELEALTSGLIVALKDPSDERVRELILLAHWEAQSYWLENYTDLYDFCFCLKRGLDRALAAHTTTPSTEQAVQGLRDNCEAVMMVLKRGTRGYDDKLIVRAEFAGPSYQYSHGLSVFFPWSRPIGSQMWDTQYKSYKLNQEMAAGASWQDFLDNYFKETMRAPHDDETDPNDPPSEVTDIMEKKLLGLLEHVAGRVFDETGQLGGPDKPSNGGPGTIKSGPDDPNGSNCSCPTIKNYPPVTRKREIGNVERNLPTSPHFFDGFRFL